MLLIFNGFLLVILFLGAPIQADMTGDTISQFNVGQIFAFYEFKGKDTQEFCLAYQFAVAKKKGSGNCQWKIKNDFSRTVIDKKYDLPIEDANKNCFFSCVPAASSKSKTWHSEKIINRYLENKGIERSDFDLYTQLAPCQNCMDGSKVEGVIEKADLDKYNKVYYNFDNGETKITATRITNDKLLDKGPKNYGLKALQQTTKVDLAKVKSEINDGKSNKKSKDEIITGVQSDEYLHNAVESFLDQHPDYIKK